MSTAPDLLLPSSSSMLPDVGGALNEDEDDAAGYQAMMSELPTIVSMSGLLDGDFDELNEIQNLLAPPVSDDDDEGQAAVAAAVAAEAAEDAYIQAMVPNPIPTGDYMATGMDVSATVAALDENLGFPSTALVVTTTAATYQSADAASTSLSVRAPTKRVHKQLEAGLVTPIYQPLSKKVKRESPAGLAQTPATIRTSLDGVNAPNPLLFGRPIRIPAITTQQGSRDVPIKEPELTKVPVKPKTPPRPTRAPRFLYPPIIKPLEKREPPKLRVPTNPLVPEVIASYAVPTCITAKLSIHRPRLCKMMFKGKVDPVNGTTDSAIARIPAPPQKIQLADISTTNSATASKKKASNKKKKPTKAKKKVGATKAKKASTKLGVKAATPEGLPKKPIKEAEACLPPASNEDAPPAKKEELMVANPLANVPPASPIKMLPPPKPKTAPVVTTTASPTPPAALVSCNNSAASDVPEDLAASSSTDVKKPANNNSKPLTAEEKAQACRDRNRQHARNTRLRKKAYVEELKQSLMGMVEDREREASATKEKEAEKADRRSNRKRALQDFLQLRGLNQRDEAKWAGLVKDPKTFQLTLPGTKYRSTLQEITADTPEQVLVGVQDVMADAAYFASFLQSLGTANDTIQTEASPVYFQYQCDESSLLVDGSRGILAWKATTCGAVSQGAKTELQLTGSVHASFCEETEKLLSARLSFDTGVIQAQLSQSPHV